LNKVKINIGPAGPTRDRARTSEAKDCSQNGNALRPYLDIGMIERSWFFSETTLDRELYFIWGLKNEIFFFAAPF
jgi:hypothetical protein